MSANEDPARLLVGPGDHRELDADADGKEISSLRTLLREAITKKSQERATACRERAKKADLLVADRIRDQRVKKGITLQALADAVGVSFQQLHKYERGLDRLTIGRLCLIAGALGASASDLIPWDLGRSER
jgi:DNA-binding transcriptional regulator YiaG